LFPLAVEQTGNSPALIDSVEVKERKVQYLKSVTEKRASVSSHSSRPHLDVPVINTTLTSQFSVSKSNPTRSACGAVLLEKESAS
jgi:hypothetical protein